MGPLIMYFAKVSQEGTAYLVEFPDAPGVQTFASNLPTAMELGKEALITWLEAALKAGQPIPEPKYQTTMDGCGVDIDGDLAERVWKARK